MNTTNESSVHAHNPLPAPYQNNDFFDYGGPGDPGKLTATARRALWVRLCQAFFYAGTTLYLWNEVPNLKLTFLSACDLKKGQKVLLISKYGAESGLTPALQSLLGQDDNIAIEEIGSRAVAAFSELDSKPKDKLRWDFHYLDSVPDGTLDRVILFGAASHVANWSSLASQIQRVLADGGKLIVAEAALGGKKFRNAMHLDSHVECWVGKILAGAGIKEDELPNLEADDLKALFEPYLSGSQAFSHDGLYVFCGQKGDDEDSTLKVPKSTPEVQEFLKSKIPSGKQGMDCRPSPVMNLIPAWEFMAEPEKKAWGDKVAEIKESLTKKSVPFSNEAQDPRRVIIGELEWMWFNNREITDLMYSNLSARNGDKVLFIGELPEDLGVLGELRKRVGESGEIVLADLTGRMEGNFKDWREKREKYYDIIGEEWPYYFADGFPDNYFDLLIFPQGVHHCNNWLHDAPRLLRSVKPGGQVLAIECAVQRPEFHLALEESPLVKLIIDRISDLFLPPLSDLDRMSPQIPQGYQKPPAEYLHEGRPYHDVPTAHLRQAFGNGLTDVISLEKKGWILFYGYKK